MKKIKINDNIYIGDSGKQLKNLVSSTNDTGWVNCTLSNSKFNVNWFETRRIGDIVTISGQLANPSVNSITNFELLGTTPFVPKEEVFGTGRVFLNTDNNVALIYINKQGKIYCVGSPISAPQIQFTFTYMIN